MIRYLTFVLPVLAIVCSCVKTIPTPEVSIKADDAFVDGEAQIRMVLSEAATTDVILDIALSAESDMFLNNVSLPESSIVIARGEQSAVVKVLFDEGELEYGEYELRFDVKLAQGHATIPASCNVVIKANVVKLDNPVYAMDYKTNYLFLFDHCVSLPVFTIEWRYFLTGDWNVNGVPNRLGCVGDKHGRGIMLRFNDDLGRHVGDAFWGLLQVSSPLTGAFYVGKNTKDNLESEESGIPCHRWEKGRWTTISVSGDGHTLKVYDNGELVCEKVYLSAQDGASLQIQSYEQGMSGTDGGDHDSPYGPPCRQNFPADLSYVRVWDKALSSDEIKANIGHVSVTDKSLVLNWAFNAGRGYIIKNLAGDESYNIDFSHAVYHKYEDLQQVDASMYARRSWVEGSNN